MSIIGIAFLSICFLFILTAAATNDTEAGAAFGFLSLLYSIPFSITALVISVKSKDNVSSSITPYDLTEKILKLHELKEKEILTESEFIKKKTEILKKKL